MGDVSFATGGAQQGASKEPFGCYRYNPYSHAASKVYLPSPEVMMTGDGGLNTSRSSSAASSSSSMVWTTVTSRNATPPPRMHPAAATTTPVTRRTSALLPPPYSSPAASFHLTPEPMGNAKEEEGGAMMIMMTGGGEQQWQPWESALMSPSIRYIEYAALARTIAANLPPSPVKSMLKRLFIGQLPFLFTDEQLNHAIAAATGKQGALMHVERIVKWTQNRAPTGCAHAYCRHEDVEAILAVHKRVVMGLEGVWVADTQQDAWHLRNHVQRHRAAGVPSGLLSVEEPRSTYVPDDRFCVKSFVATTF